MKAAKFEVFGAVQGVGFRPFVYKLAVDLRLKGEVYNDGEGVKIIVCAELSEPQKGSIDKNSASLNLDEPNSNEIQAQKISSSAAQSLNSAESDSNKAANSSLNFASSNLNESSFSPQSTPNLPNDLTGLPRDLANGLAGMSDLTSDSQAAASEKFLPNLFETDLNEQGSILPASSDQNFIVQNSSQQRGISRNESSQGLQNTKRDLQGAKRDLQDFKHDSQSAEQDLREEEILKIFERRLSSEAPPLCRIDKIIRTDLNTQDFTQNFTDFKITQSKEGRKFNPILPDFAICDQCKKEFYDPQNPRFHYPFINCTDCGPRLSIIAALPYDRANTTMRAFEMCEFCRGEYTDPLTRRYHAEPISCPHCGPQLFLCGAGGEILSSGEEAIARTAELLRRGQIGAIKGMGGFHIVCDATNERAVRMLRTLKKRPSKPFAIMCRDAAQAWRAASLSAEEEALIDCNVKPIVILKKREFVWRTEAGFAADFGTQNLKARGENSISPRFAGEQEEAAQEQDSELQNLRNFVAQKFSTQSAEDYVEQGGLQNAQIFSKTAHRNFACDMLTADDLQSATNELERAYDGSDLQRAAKNLSSPQAEGELELRHTTNKLNLQSAADSQDLRCAANELDFRLATDEPISQNSANIRGLRHAEDGVGSQRAACESDLRQKINSQDSCFVQACVAEAHGAYSDSEGDFVRLPASFSAIFRAGMIFIAPSVAPDLNKIGIFLANTGVHLLLFEYFDRPIVATSANISGEPIIFSSEELRAKLGGVISFYLDNDREILTPSDDSIAFVPRFASLVPKSEAAQSISQNFRSPQSAPFVNDQAPQKNGSTKEQNLLQKADVVAAEKQNASQKLSYIAKEEATQSFGARGLGAQRDLASGVFSCGADMSPREPATKRDFMRELLRNRALFLRTSRGMNPKIFPSKFQLKGTFLALGAELKNEFAIYKDGQIFISPYIGDLKNVATNERFFALLDMFVRAYELKFDAVIADLHPQFLHTRFFEQRGYPVVRYQHHFAHLVSNLAQNDLLFSGKKYLGFCFDGTGYGTDSTIWGGEVMVFDPRGYRRVAKFDEIALIGGESAIKNIYKLALALVFKFNAKDAAREFLAKFNASEVANLEKIAPRAVRSSSLGRLFDAFAAVICDLRAVSFDGEAGMRLENLYIQGCEQSYKFRLKKAGENFIQNAPYSASQQRGVDDLRHETQREAKQGGLNAQNHSGAKNSCALRGDFKELKGDMASKNELERAAENIVGGGEKNTNIAANSIKQASALNLINLESKDASSADQSPQNRAYAPSLEGECYVIDYEEAFLQALSDEPGLAATKFINGLANFIAEFAEDFGLEVALSGGVFQNATLLNLTCAKLRARGIKFHLNRAVPCNDSGIAYGQLAAYLSEISR